MSQSEKSIEHVLVIPRSEFEAAGFFTGVSEPTDALLDLLHSSTQRYIERPAAEKDPSYKQLIPYVVFTALIDGESKILSYFRAKVGQEDRLHDKVSIGVGGHINPGDIDYDHALFREMREELVGLPEPMTQIQFPVINFVNEEETPVGQVHLGVVHWYACENPQFISTAEQDLAGLAWRTWEELKEMNLEKWSRLILEESSMLRR